MDNSTHSPQCEQLEKLTDIIEVLDFCVRHNLPAELVGRWVWLKFDQKPSKETRDKIKAVGFRWSRRRGKWAHNCGHPTTRSNGDPFWKYGVVPVTDDLVRGIGQPA